MLWIIFDMLKSDITKINIEEFKIEKDKWTSLAPISRTEAIESTVRKLGNQESADNES